jgi:hypothetical protein
MITKFISKWIKIIRKPKTYKGKRKQRVRLTRSKVALNSISQRMFSRVLVLPVQCKCTRSHTRCAWAYSRLHQLFCGVGMGSSAYALEPNTMHFPPDHSSRGLHFFAFSTFKPQFSLNDLQNTKTTKLTKNIRK